MNLFKSLKTIIIVAILPLLASLQPAITYACNASSHCGG